MPCINKSRQELRHVRGSVFDEGDGAGYLARTTVTHTGDKIGQVHLDIPSHQRR